MMWIEYYPFKTLLQLLCEYYYIVGLYLTYSEKVKNFRVVMVRMLSFRLNFNYNKLVLVTFLPRERFY